MPQGRPRPRARSTARQPGFLWQGVLIVLPALLLAGFGLFSLRQDRLLALQQATQEAQRIAAGLAEKTLPEALVADAPSPALNLIIQQGPVPPEQDPILRLASGSVPRLAWLVDSDGALVFPPPVAPAPLPQPLDIARLSPEQQTEWSALDPASTFTAPKRLQLAPPRFVALALFRLGLSHLNRNESVDAQNCFARITTQYSNELSEAGYPLRVFAWLHLLRLADHAQTSVADAEQLSATLCRYAVTEPSTLSESLLDAVESSPTGRRIAAPWRRLWQTHEQARALHWQFNRDPMEAPQSPMPQETTRWIDEPGAHAERWLITPASASEAPGPSQWFIAIREEHVRQVLDSLISSLPRPDYLGLSVTAGERPLVSLQEQPEMPAAPVPLAQAALPATGFFQTGPQPARALPPFPRTPSTRGHDPLTVTVYLTAPHKLYARQRVRTFWSTGIIAFSFAAVLMGFTTAWRAFRRQQQLAEMKSNFVSAVSHELRAPIASIRLMSEELQDLGDDAAARGADYHRLIAQECRRLSALIENVLHFARHEQGRKEYAFEPTDLVALVEETLKLMQPCAAERQIKLTARCAPQILTADADGRALQQALVNLLDNAIKHSPQNTIVTVGLERAASTPPETQPNPGRASAQGDSLVSLWVEDHGEGIPPEDHQRIFERFYRRGSELRRQTPGIGLGLAIVKYVAEAHRGRVLVRSAVGQGSRFTIQWPMTNHTGENS